MFCVIWHRAKTLCSLTVAEVETDCFQDKGPKSLGPLFSLSSHKMIAGSLGPHPNTRPAPMTEFAASRFPALTPPEPALPHRGALGLSLSLLPLPIGEISVLMTAWLLVLPV